MARKRKPNLRKKRKVNLYVYYNYDVGGGGLPFGHQREFRVELEIAKVTLVRHRAEARELKSLVEKRGAPIGKRKSFPRDKGYSPSSYSRQYLLPTNHTVRSLEARIPYVGVL
jgi:hypothetical protein